MLPPRLQRIQSIFQLISLLSGSCQLFLAKLTADVKGASKKANVKPSSATGSSDFWNSTLSQGTALLSPYLYSSPTFLAKPSASSSMLPFDTCPCSSGSIKLIKEGISWSKTCLSLQPHSGFLYFSNGDSTDRLSHLSVLRTNTVWTTARCSPNTPTPAALLSNGTWRVRCKRGGRQSHDPLSSCLHW